MFETVDGDGALALRRRFAGREDYSYGGYDDRWRGMIAVLKQKFQPEARMALRLRETGDAFLLEHNDVAGRDPYWSDNHDGHGWNRLGLLLMLIRDELTGHRAWTKFMIDACQLNPSTGHIGAFDPIGRDR